MKREAVNGLVEVEPNANVASAPLSVPPGQAWKAPADFARLGMLFGLFTGLAEFAVRCIIAYGLHHPSHHDFGIDLLWMLPFANLVSFGILGLILGIVGMRWHGRLLPRVALAAFVAGGVYALLLHFRSIHEIVSAILSIGVGVRMADLLDDKSNGLQRLVRRATWPALAALVLAAFAFRATEALTERRTRAALSPAQANAPNVLVIVLDAVRAPELSAYGYERRTTPQLERLAKRSVRFERAIVTAPWSLPSHASMFSGRYAHEMTADWDVPLDETYPTLAEVLRDRGYVTGGFVGNTFYGSPEFGLSRGFMHYESRKFNFTAMVATSRLANALLRLGNRVTNGYYRPSRMNALEINRRLLDWLPSRESRPFFVFVNYFDAHEPFVPPAPYNRAFRDTEPSTRRVREGTHKTAAELQGLRDAYDQSIAYVDSQLGALLDQLERRGLLSNTLVVVTSDHGEEFGEHGWVSHGNGLYLPALHVPLVISFPGHVPEGAVVEDPITLRDLPATVLYLTAGNQRNIPGNSLSWRWSPAPDSTRMTMSPVLSEVRSPRNNPSWYASARGDMQSIVTGRHHYIRNGDGREELFDIVSDPWEAVDLAKTESGKAMLVTARAALNSATRSGAHTVPADETP